MQAPETECVEARQHGASRGSVIWLHGLGADGHDFEPIVPDLSLPVDFIFPHAPVRPVTLNGGYPMRAWFDLYSLDRDMQIDHQGLGESVATVEALIAREAGRGTPADRIVIGGFSQGGAVALYSGLRHRERLAGLVGLSSWLQMPGSLDGVADANRDVPILMAHGTLDPIVDHRYGAATRDALRAGGWDVEWHEYPMPHTVCADELAALKKFLERVLVR